MVEYVSSEGANSQPMRIVSVVGARPQFVKLAPIAAEAAHRHVEHVIVHTGQHYDPGLSDAFFADLQIPAPDVHLGVGSGGHGAQTGAMMTALDPVLEEYSPDWVLVYGDTNSTLAAALCAVKLHLPLAHLEAGLRSFNRRMPEEHNRVLTDHAADLLLAPTEVARAHLAAEGLAGRTVVTGDVMTDVCYRVRDAVMAEPPGIDLPDGEFVLSTLHRAENTDDPQRLAELVGRLAGLDVPVVLTAHPRLVTRAAEAGISLEQGNLLPVPPLPYPSLVWAVLRSSGIVTDSGGLQKEAYLLQRACTTLRTETEWVETLDGGWNVLDPDAQDLAALATRHVDSPQGTPYGDGHAASAVLDALEDRRGEDQAPGAR